MYIYEADVIEVYDGDTITVNIDLGFNTHLHKQKFRLLYIDAPELRGDDKEFGKQVRDIVRDMILGKKVILKTFNDSKGKYGRWLCEVWVGDLNLNEWLIENQYAKLYEPDLIVLKKRKLNEPSR